MTNSLSVQMMRGSLDVVILVDAVLKQSSPTTCQCLKSMKPLVDIHIPRLSNIRAQ